MLKQMVEENLGFSVCEQCGPGPGCLYLSALIAGTRKQDSIIRNEGDANGHRRGDIYLAQLVAEAVQSRLLTQYSILNATVKRHRERAPRQPAETPISKKTTISVAQATAKDNIAVSAMSIQRSS